MKKWWIILIVAATLAVLISGCGNFRPGNPIGVPTVTISLGERSLTQSEKGWTLAFTLKVYNLPGSPGGTINSFRLLGGGALTAGLYVSDCPVKTQTNCDPTEAPFKIDLSSYPPAGTYIITAYDAAGQNGKMLTIKLPTPLIVH